METGWERWSKEELQRRTEGGRLTEPVSGGASLWRWLLGQRGDQDNGPRTRCCSALHLQLNDHSAVFITGETGWCGGGRCGTMRARCFILMLKSWRACWFPGNVNINAAKPKHIIKLSRTGLKYKSCLNMDEKETVGGRAEICRAAALGLSKSVWRKKKKKSYKTQVCLQPVAARSLRSHSVLRNKMLCQKVNCMLTTLSHRKDCKAFQN